MNQPHWSLEIVRGRDVGRAYPLGGGEITLGNALNGSAGINLADQEGSGPRRMAAKQAVVECAGDELRVRDLDSPGGTFVNRQRLLPGQSRALKDGDIIQLASLQLRVVAARPRTRAPAPPVPASTETQASRPSVSPANRPEPSTAALAKPYTLPSGVSCRTWDDFLTVSAQRWPALRDELTSGRLAAFLLGVQRPDLAPLPDEPGSPDERLDAWLGRLPTTRPREPELDVHPDRLVVRATAGGIRRQTVQVTNVGFRLLRSTARVEPASASWARVAGEFSGRTFVTVERTELPIEVTIPETLDRPLTAMLVVEGNGGTRRVEIRVERPPAQPTLPEDGGAEPRSDWSVREAIAGLTPARRIALAAGGLGLLRLLAGLANGLAGGAAGSSIGLLGPGIAVAVLSGLASIRPTLRRGEPRDLPASCFASAFAGLLGAALFVAGCRAVEGRLGSVFAHSLVANTLLWAAIGAIGALVSAWLVPARPRSEPSP